MAMFSLYELMDEEKVYQKSNVLVALSWQMAHVRSILLGTPERFRQFPLDVCRRDSHVS